MKKQVSNSFIILFVLIITSLFVIYYFFFIQIAHAGQNILDLSQLSAQQTREQEQIKNLASSLNTSMPEVDQINSYSIASDGEVAFIDSLESTARAHGLSIQINSVQIEQSDALTTSNFEYLTLRMTTNGNWSAMYRFLSLLPNFPYQISIDQADITVLSDQKSVASPVWQGTFAIHVLKKIN